MSYDYILVKGKLGAGIEAFAEAAMAETIGPVEEVKKKISQIFPSVHWGVASEIPGMSGSVVSGHNGPPEFQLSVEADGEVRMITMSRAEKSEMELAAKTLGLVGLDEQSMDMFDG